MIELTLQREAMARAEASVSLSMQQPTVATRMEALQRQFETATGDDREALIVVVAARLAIDGREADAAIRY